VLFRHHLSKRPIARSVSTKKVDGGSSSGDQDKDMWLGATLPGGAPLREGSEKESGMKPVIHLESR